MEPTPGRHLPLETVSIRGTAGDPTGSAGTPTTPGASTPGNSHFDFLSRKPTGVTHGNNNNNNASRRVSLLRSLINQIALVLMLISVHIQQHHLQTK